METSTDKHEALVRQYKSKIKDRTFTYDELLDFAAHMAASLDTAKASLKLIHSKLQDSDDKHNDEIRRAFDAMDQTVDKIVEAAIDDGIYLRKSRVSGGGGDARHAPHRKARDEVYEWWKKWQENSGMYKNKMAFDKAMEDKLDGVIKDRQTIAKWRRQFQNGL